MALSDVDFHKFSNEELCGMVDDLNKPCIADNALIRQVARKVYDRHDVTLPMMIGLAVPIATEFARRIRNTKSQALKCPLCSSELTFEYTSTYRGEYSDCRYVCRTCGFETQKISGRDLEQIKQQLIEHFESSVCSLNKNLSLSTLINIKRRMTQAGLTPREISITLTSREVHIALRAVEKGKVYAVMEIIPLVELENAHVDVVSEHIGRLIQALLHYKRESK